jgi:CheY-like chemotaxis protein/two-component sensor histidine kinase
VPILDAAGNVREWIGANTDITERNRAEESAREDARRKDVFLATLAHELRNPLAPIRSGIEILRMETPDPARFQEICAIMERQTQQLIVLVDDLLDVSRITRGKLSLRKSPVKLSEVVEIAIGTVTPLFDEAGHQLTVDIPDGGIMIEADPHRMAQVLSNLLSNAAKYTPPGGCVRLAARAEGPELLISVRDSGIGIPPEMREAIFDMFTQVDQPLEEGVRGLGIGLTLVKSLVEMHDGSIEALSDGVGQGSEFLIRAPIVVTERPNRPRAPRKHEPPEQPKRRVLVVDDNEAAAEMLALLLEKSGNEVRTANDGEKAVELAGLFNPDLVLMDLGMPRVDGLEAARRIRSKPWGRSMFLAALTGFGQESDKRRTKEAGFDFHLVKPVNTEDLRRLLSGSERNRYHADKQSRAREQAGPLPHGRGSEGGR